MGWSHIGILNIISAFLLIFFSFFLIGNKKGKKLSNGILAALLLTNAVCLLDYIVFLRRGGPSGHVLDYLKLGNSLVFLWGPLIYFYTRSMIHRDFAFQRKNSIHLFPFAAYILYLGSKLAGIAKGAGHNPELGRLTFLPQEIFVLSLSLHALFLFYLLASFHSLRVYRTQIKNMFSNIQNLRLSWLSLMLVCLSVIWTIGALNSYLSVKSGSPVSALSLVNLVLIFFIANTAVYKGLKQPEIFSGIDEGLKYQKSTLTESDAKRFLVMLKNLMVNEKPYLDPSLTINQLAKKLGMQTRHLSQIINESYHQNFYDFINTFRIQEAKKQLSIPAEETPTILKVLLDVGFNSKSAFNSAFKKITGMTPSEFRKTRLNQ